MQVKCGFKKKKIGGGGEQTSSVLRLPQLKGNVCRIMASLDTRREQGHLQASVAKCTLGPSLSGRDAVAR